MFSEVRVNPVLRFFENNRTGNQIVKGLFAFGKKRDKIADETSDV